VAGKSNFDSDWTYFHCPGATLGSNLFLGGRMGAHTSLIKDANLFLLAFLLLFLFYLGRFYIWRFLLASSPLRPLSTYHVFRSRIASRAVKLALLLSLGLGIFLEIYYQSRCPVSRSYYQTNIMLAHEIIDTLTQLNVAFWPDFATLLNVVRCATSPPYLWSRVTGRWHRAGTKS